jgi:hypothetical protein
MNLSKVSHRAPAKSPCEICCDLVGGIFKCEDFNVYDFVQWRSFGRTTVNRPVLQFGAMNCDDAIRFNYWTAMDWAALKVNCPADYDIQTPNSPCGDGAEASRSVLSCVRASAVGTRA